MELTQTQLDKRTLEKDLAERDQGFSPQWLAKALTLGITSRPEVSDPGCRGLNARIESEGITFRWYVKAPIEKVEETGRWRETTTAKSVGVTIGEFTVQAYPGKMTLARAQGWVVELKRAKQEGRLVDALNRLEDEKAMRPDLPRVAPKADPNAKTVEELARAFYDLVITSGPHPRRKRQWHHAERVLFRTIVPALGAKRLLTDVTPPMCGDIIAGIARTSAATAAKVGQELRSMFKYAQARGWLVYNPCDPLDYRRLGASAKGKKPMRALEPAELSMFWHTLDVIKPGARGVAQTVGLNEVTKWALRLCLVIPDRSGELLLAEKREFDLEKGVWTVPVEHIKLCSPAAKEAARPLRVPLSPLAIEIIRKLFAADPTSPWLLPSKKSNDGKLNMGALADVCRRRFGDHKGKLKPFVELPGGPFTPHDLRKTFSTLCRRSKKAGGLGFDKEQVEPCLSHSLGKGQVEATYNLDDLFDARAEVLNAWAEYVARHVGANPPAKVIPLRRVP